MLSYLEVSTIKAESEVKIQLIHILEIMLNKTWYRSADSGQNIWFSTKADIMQKLALKCWCKRKKNNAV